MKGTNHRSSVVRGSIFVVLAILIASTLLAYRDVGQCGFVNLDDDAYVEFQPMVNQGLRPTAFVWAFTSIHSNNWHPLTTLSHALDCQLFGLRAAPMHWENVLWHLLNTLLVFFIFRKMSDAEGVEARGKLNDSSAPAGGMWRPALVAALFALHPLHVESVAWISERKDVLSTFFGLLSILFYLKREAGKKVAIVRSRFPSASFLSLLFFGASLLCKPMFVTLPFIFLLLDFWPLRKVASNGGRVNGNAIPRLILEKLPFLLLAVVLSGITIAVQTSSGAADYGQRFSLAERLDNACISYIRYLAKTCWPASLSPLYFHPGKWPVLFVIGSAMTLILGAFISFRARSRPWLMVGWLWFLGALVPVIGVVQVGSQSMADRYTYFPLLGIFIIVGWELGEFVTAFPKTRVTVCGVTVMTLIGCLLLSQRQVLTWKNSITLYEASIAHGNDNAAVRYLLGTAMQSAGRSDAEVAPQFRRALELQPDYINAMTQLALIAFKKQHFDEARQWIEQTIRYEPKNPAVYKTLGAFCQRIGQTNEAMVHYTEALQIDPGYADARWELGQLYEKQSRFEEARKEIEFVMRSNPWNTDALLELGTVAAAQGRYDEAKKYLEKVLWIRPDSTSARNNLQLVEQRIAQRN